MKKGKQFVVLNLLKHHSNTTAHALNAKHIYQDDVSLLQETLKEKHNEMLWQILVYKDFDSNEITHEKFVLHHDYIFYFPFYEE